MINIYGLSKQDILQLLVTIYNSKDPDQAVGIDLDAVNTIRGITPRKGGTYTIVPIVVVVSANLSLQGQDTTTPYTIADSLGNQYQLITSANLTTGSNTVNFTAVDMGAVQPSLHTINVPVTVIAGVTSVDNAAAPSQVGSDQETDAIFRLRSQALIGLPAQGMKQGLRAGLLSLDGVIEEIVHENFTNTNPDAFGVPAHYIWVIVDGGVNLDIANIIYKYRSGGCGMKGAVTQAITQIDGTTFTAAWDVAVASNLYIQMEVSSISGGIPDIAGLKAYLTANYILKINETADITALQVLVRAFSSDLLVSTCGVSLSAGTYTDKIAPAAIKDKLVAAVARMAITAV